MSELSSHKLRLLLVCVASLVLIFSALCAFPALASATVTYSPEELAVVTLINNYRVNNGLNPLLVSDALSDSSTKHSHDMGKYNFFGHITVSSDYFRAGANPGERMVQCGYPLGHGWGENIAGGQDTAYAVFTAWVNSDPHNKNMLSTQWKEMGIGFETVPGSDYGTYWTTDFGDYIDGTAHENGEPVPPDTTPPTATITSPSSGSDVSGLVTVAINASDFVGVATVELYCNGYWVATDTSSPYAISWDTTQLNPGTYVLEARAYDAAGNVGTAAITLHTSGGSSTSTTTTSTTTPTTTTTTTTSSTSTTTTSTTLAGGSFPDVPAGSPFYQSVKALAGKGVISGFGDGLFRPTAFVTRAQFTKIIMLALGEHTSAIDNTTDPTFSDVPYRGSDYPFDYVEEAAGLNIIDGYADGTFRPGSNVTRLQLALMLVRAAGDELSKPPAGYSCPFTDVPAYGRAAVTIARYNGVLAGKSSVCFDPYTPATRGEVAKMVYGLTETMQKQKSN